MKTSSTRGGIVLYPNLDQPHPIRKGWRWMAGGLLLVGLIGCSNPQEPSAKNFEQVIRQRLTTKDGEVCIKHLVWPETIRMTEGSASIDFGPTGHESRMAALEQVGLIQSRIEVENHWFGKVKLKQHSPTEAAARDLRTTEVPDHTFGGVKRINDLCWARMHLEKITKWLGPQKLGQYEVVSVKYTYRLDDVREWARAPAVLQAYPEIKRALDEQGQVERNANLHLTSIGWEFND